MNFLTTKVKKASKTVANNKIKKLSLAIGLSCTLLSQQVLALTLSSEIDQQSVHIFQPLDIKVDLIDKNNEISGQDIFVNMASVRTFEKLGLDRNYFLSKVKVELKTDTSGNRYVHLTSKDLVKEPFLMFLLELTWANGHLFKDYTVLFDAPLTQNRSSQSVTLSNTVVNKPLEVKEQVKTESLEPVVIIKQNIENPAQRYTVMKTDTLWDIALKTRPQDDISIQQMMLSIKDKNPKAFVNNNINIIKAGAVLDIPTAAETLLRSESSANKEVYSQNEVTQVATTANETEKTQPQIVQSDSIDDMADEKTSEEMQSKDKQSQAVTGQLRLVTSDENLIDTQSVSGNQDSVIDSLENDLAIAMDVVEKEKREQADNQILISELEEQNETLQKILDLKSKELAELQRQLSDQKAAAVKLEELQSDEGVNDTLEPILDLETAEAETDVYVDVDVETALIDESSYEEANLSEVEDLINHLEVDDSDPQEDDLIEVDSIVQESVQLEQVVQEPQMEVKTNDAGIIEQAKAWLLKSNINMAIAGISGLLLLVLIASLFTRNKRKDDTDVEDENFDTLDDLESFEEMPVSDDLDDDLLSDIDLGSDEFANIDQTDPLEEAQKSIDYGDMDKGIQILEDAYQADTSRSDIALKLLALYGQESQNDKFADLEARVSINAPGSVLNEIEALNKQFHPSNIESTDSLSVDLEPLELSSESESIDNIDLDGLDLDAIELEEAAVSDSDELSLDIDFDSLDDASSDVTIDASLSDLEGEDTLTLEDESFEIELDDELLSIDSEVNETEVDASLDFDLEEIDLELDNLDLSDLDVDVDVNDGDQNPDGLEVEIDSLEVEDLEVTSNDEPQAEISIDLSETGNEESFDLSLDELDSELAELDAQFSTETDIEPEESKPTDNTHSMTADEVSIEIEDEIESEIDFMGDNDENSTKLNLAKAFIEMGDVDSAKEMLEEIIDEGNDEQKSEAKKMIDSL